MAYKNFCDHCNREIIECKEMVKVITYNKYSLGETKVFHRDCFNKRFSTNIDLIKDGE